MTDWSRSCCGLDKCNLIPSLCGELRLFRQNQQFATYRILRTEDIKEELAICFFQGRL